MASEPKRDASPLVVEIEPWLKKRVEAAAATRGVSVRDFVVAVLGEALDNHGVARATAQNREWSQVSAPVFARDWDSDADAVYDDLA